MTRKQLPETAAKLRKRLQELQAEQEMDSAHKVESLPTEAKRLLNLAEQSKLQAEIKLYNFFSPTGCAPGR